MRAGGSMEPAIADPSQSRIDRCVSTIAERGKSDQVARARKSARVRETCAMLIKMAPSSTDVILKGVAPRPRQPSFRGEEQPSGALRADCRPRDLWVEHRASC